MDDLQARCANLQALLQTRIATATAIERNLAVAWTVDSAGQCSKPSWSGWQLGPTTSVIRSYWRRRSTVTDYRMWVHDQRVLAERKAAARAERERADEIKAGLERPHGPASHMYLSQRRGAKRAVK